MNRQRDYYDDDQVVDADYEPMRQRSSRGRQQDSPPPPPMMKRAPTAVRHYKKMFFVAFLMIVLAFILTASAEYPEAPDRDDEEDFDDWQDRVDTYEDITRALNVTAGLFLSLGALLMVFGFLIGGFLDTELPTNIRVMMFIAAIVLIALFIASGARMSVSLSS